MKNQRTLSLVALICGSGIAFAAPMEFDFKDPKSVNNIVFQLDAPLEAINGTANGVSGKVTYDAANPGALKGKIALATASLHVPNAMMKEHLHGDKWMEVAKHPEITFEAVKADNVKNSGNDNTADITGKLTIKGVTKTITVPTRITYLKDRLKDRLPNMQGDLLVLRSKFNIKRSDFGINPGGGEDKVSDTIELSMSLAGMAPRK